MPDKKHKPERQTPHKDKLCKACGRPFQWTEQKARDWDVIKYCSDACRGHQTTATDAALEAAILQLLHDRAADRGPDRGKDLTICPSEAAILVGTGEKLARGRDKATRHDWESLMEPARAAARRLVAAGKILITQQGQPVDPSTAKGPIRLKLR
jgi:hypothetical protein